MINSRNPRAAAYRKAMRLYNGLNTFEKKWLSVNAVKTGGIVRRSVKWVRKLANERRVQMYVEAMGWRIRCQCGQYIVYSG